MPEYIEREALLRDGAAQKVGGVFDKAGVLGKRGAVRNVGEASRQSFGYVPERQHIRSCIMGREDHRHYRLCAVAVRTRQGGTE